MKIPIEISCLGLLREYVIQREEGSKPLVVGHGLIPHQMKLGALDFSSSVWILNGEGLVKRSLYIVITRLRLIPLLEDSPAFIRHDSDRVGAQP